jgi:hypothetical protein
VAEERLLPPQHELASIVWPGGGVEHHPSHGDWIRELRAAGFVIDALHELYASPDAVTPEYYDIVTAEWARRWAPRTSGSLTWRDDEREGNVGTVAELPELLGQAVAFATASS